MDSLTTNETHEAAGGLSSTTLLMGLLAAGLGALAWGAVAFFAGYEVGYIAWALGGLVGLAMVKFGGRGVTCAVAAAVLAVVGIAGGKLLGTRFAVETALREGCEETFTPDLHRELMHDAADFARLDEGNDEELLGFIVEHHYTSADSTESVPDAELEAFLATAAVDLRAMHADQPSYEDWYAARVAEARRDFEQDVSIVQANIEALDPIDLLFVVLGVTTAFGMVRRAGDPGTGPGGQLGQDERKAA